MKKINKQHISAAVVTTLMTAAAASPALADTKNNPAMGMRVDDRMGMMDGNTMRPMMRAGMGAMLMGTTTAISGTTLTVSGSLQGPRGTISSYTVDASKAVVHNNGATTTLSAITVGTPVMVRGNATGTSMIATDIMLGMPGRDRDGDHDRSGKGPAAGMGAIFSGNGQPVTAGTVASISGSTVTFSNKNGSYTVDATNAKVLKGGATSTVSAIAVGDTIMVQGTTNGMNITASTILDQGKAASVTGNASTDGNNGNHYGMFTGVINVLKRLFGF